MRSAVLKSRPSVIRNVVSQGELSPTQIAQIFGSITQFSLSELANFSYVYREGINKISRVYNAHIGVCLYKESSQFTEFSVQLAIERGSTQKFLRIQQIFTLAHANLISYYGVVSEKMNYTGYLLEEFSQISLEKYPEDDDEIPVERILSWMVQLARALTYCHEIKNVVHGAVKPENIYYSGETVKLGNFPFDLIPDPTLTVRHCRHDFSAPEVILGNGYTAASDVYSLGMTMYFLIYKTLPFADCPRHLNNQLNFRHFLEQGNRPSFPEGQQIASGLRELVEDCWRTDAGSRPAAKEVLDRLIHIQENLQMDEELEDWDLIRDIGGLEII